MQQNYQVRFLSRPGSRGRPRAALGNGIISHAHSWGELRSDTYHKHTGIHMNPARLYAMRVIHLALDLQCFLA